MRDTLIEAFAYSYRNCKWVQQVSVASNLVFAARKARVAFQCVSICNNGELLKSMRFYNLTGQTSVYIFVIKM